jgi:hypothetical protein
MRVGKYWNDFSYTHSGTQVQMQIRAQNVPDNTFQTGICEFPMCAVKGADGKSFGKLIQDWIPRYVAADEAKCRLIDIVDGDLNAPIGEQGPIRVNFSSYVSYFWRRRAIENMLLPSTCPLWFVLSEDHRALANSKFREVFQRIFMNFFGDSAPPVQRITGWSRLIWSRTRNVAAGPGWMGWHSRLLPEQLKTPEYVAMQAFLLTVIRGISSQSSHVSAPSVLVLYELFCRVDRCNDDTAIIGIFQNCEEFFGCLSDFEARFPGLKSDNSDPFECTSVDNRYLEFAQAKTILFSCGQTLQFSHPNLATAARTNYFDRNKTNPNDFLLRFPQFIAFLNRVCCVDSVEPELFQKIRVASLQFIRDVFKVICAAVFDLDDALLEQLQGGSISHILLTCETNRDCEGYLPRTDSKACMSCDKSGGDHVLRFKLNHADCRVDAYNSSSAESHPDVSSFIFSKLVCRVGCMGWDSHDYMKLVHGSTHLGEEFHPDFIEKTRESYRKHLSPEVTCDSCLKCSIPIDALREHLRNEVELLNGQCRKELESFVIKLKANFEEV